MDAAREAQRNQYYGPVAVLPLGGLRKKNHSETEIQPVLLDYVAIQSENCRRLSGLRRTGTSSWRELYGRHIEHL
jgi:hypothetical protein